jgi:hypothetical protein
MHVHLHAYVPIKWKNFHPRWADDPTPAIDSKRLLAFKILDSDSHEAVDTLITVQLKDPAPVRKERARSIRETLHPCVNFRPKGM